MADDADNRLRLLILELADEDCYGVKEFVGNVAELYPNLSKQAMIDRLKIELAELAAQDLVRVHKGAQCAGNSRAGADMTVNSGDIAAMAESHFTPYTDDMVCICYTTNTQRAYADAYAEVNGSAT